MLELTPLAETRAVRQWKQEARVAILAWLIECKFGVPAGFVTSTIARLSNETLYELADQILIAQTAHQLAAWIEARK